MSDSKPEQLLLNEIQVLLAEKRTYYALLRTAMLMITVPLSVILFLIATTSYHSLFGHWWLAILVIGVLIVISVSGVFTLNQSRWKLRKINKIMRNIEKQNPRVAELLV